MASATNAPTILERLPYDVVTLVLPHLDLFDIARCRLVSRGFYRLFTDDSVCRFTLKQLFNLAPESFGPSAGHVELTRLIARTSRWVRKDPSRIEKVLVAKGSAAPTCLGWGVAGDILAYQSPSHIEGGEESDRSKLILRCLGQSRREISLDLVDIDPLFDSVQPDELNKWRIWIPQSADRGDKFLTGQKQLPKFMMVASHPRTKVQLQSNPRGVPQRIRDFLNRRAHATPTTVHQALAVVSLDPATLGQVVCHWTIDDEVRCFDANAHYFVYSKKGSKHKYNVCLFDKIIPTWPAVRRPAGLDEVAKSISTFAFLTTKEIYALGADVSGNHLFVSFASSAQIIDVKTGMSLKKTDLSMPPLRDTVPASSVKSRFSFFLPTETTSGDNNKHLTIDLCCHLLYDEVNSDLIHHRQATALWKLDASIRADGTISNLGWRPAFMTTPKISRQHLPVSLNSMTLSSNRLHECLSIPTVRVNAEQMRAGYRSSYAYHHHRSFTLVGSFPSIVTNLYNVSIFEDGHDDDAADGPDSAKSAKWLQPTSSVHVLSPSDAKASTRSARSASGRVEVKIPKPTVDCAPIAVGCGWVVFAKDRSDQCTPLNLYGRIGNIRKADELVIVRFD
ncbi:hypothetical protein TWF696_004400 [Orbilia brochopaga]|uniref:F-box domain-containing protein n=1 Tax=Orbilia brochopaga TaxID=3140254 RepID=A0AAV9V9W5_9PEZI